MQCRRDGNKTLSPLRELYGKKDGYLLFPLDIVLTIDLAGETLFKLPLPAGALNGEAVRCPGTMLTGTIARYDWPPADGQQVYPFTVVSAPADCLDVVPEGAAPVAEIIPGDRVELEVVSREFQRLRSGIQGTIVEAAGAHPYPDAEHRVLAYRVDFDRPLPETRHGARVALCSTGQLLGMLCATRNQDDGTCQTLVFPAHLV